jgi:TRAP-type C4-dicarboxylate transport system permease small subunit
MLDRALDRIAQTLLVLAALLGFGLSFIVVADVIGRVAFNHPLKGTPEIVSFSIVVICYLQAAYAIRSGGMINVDAFTIHLPDRVQSLLAAFGCVLGTILFALVCWGSIDGAVHAWTTGEFEGEGALRVPVWPARFVIVLGCALAALSYFLLSLRQFNAFFNGEPPVVSSSTSH